MKVLATVWQRQKRWVSYQSHTHPLTLSGPSMPQGDPMGPVIMTLWAWLGWLHVERRCRRVPHVVTRVYVHDRSFAVSRVWALSERYHHWSDWSASVGVCENQAKAFAVASTPARRTTLRHELPQVVHGMLSCMVHLAWLAGVACSLENMPALILVVRPLLCLLALAFLLKGTCVHVGNLLLLKLPMVGSLALPR